MQRAETILTVGNTLWLVGLTAYSYRQISFLKAELEDNSEALSRLIEEVKKLKTPTLDIPRISSAVRKLDTDIRELSYNSPSTDDIDVIMSQMDLIINTLRDNSIDVENVTLPYRGYGGGSYLPPNSSSYRNVSGNVPRINNSSRYNQQHSSNASIINNGGRNNRNPNGNHPEIRNNKNHNNFNNSNNFNSNFNQETEGEEMYDEFDPVAAVEEVRNRKTNRY